jgi:hypothetical protein
MTLPVDPPAYSTVFPEGTAKPLPANAITIIRIRKHCNERIPCPLFYLTCFWLCNENAFPNWNCLSSYS